MNNEQAISVVYLITDTITGLKYIGSKRKWNAADNYFGSISSKTKKIDLQRQWKYAAKTRPETFVKEILFFSNYHDISINDLIAKERQFHESYDVVNSKEFVNASMANKGFAGHEKGQGFSAKALAKAAKLKRDNGLPNNHRESIRLSLIGRTHSEQTKAKIAKARIGQTHTEKTKLQIAETKKGTTLSEEHKLKISNGVKNAGSERGIRSGQSRLGRKASEEHKAAIRRGHAKRKALLNRDSSIDKII